MNFSNYSVSLFLSLSLSCSSNLCFPFSLTFSKRASHVESSLAHRSLCCAPSCSIGSRSDHVSCYSGRLELYFSSSLHTCHVSFPMMRWMIRTNYPASKTFQLIISMEWNQPSSSDPCSEWTSSIGFWNFRFESLSPCQINSLELFMILSNIIGWKYA